MLKVISCNLNGIRSAQRKGFFKWLQTQNADFICLQETKAHLADLDLAIFTLVGYKIYFSDAQKKGYSGVAILTKHAPESINVKLGNSYLDHEGRFIELNYNNFRVVSLYLPSGTSGELRQGIKMDLLDYFYDEYLSSENLLRNPTIICGDWNIAHKPIDLKNWKQNQNNSGFLPEERAWLDKVFANGWVDAFRVLNHDPEQYTWWSFRGRARTNNVGWRIDYQVVSPSLADSLQSVSIYKDELFSDHAPLVMDYDYVLA